MAEKIVKDKQLCVIKKMKTFYQQMGNLSKENFHIPCKSFTHLCIDLTGPYQMKAMDNAPSN